MSYFKATMHQIRFRLGLRPSYLLAGFKGPTSKGKEGKGRGKGGERKGQGEGKWGEGVDVVRPDL